MTFSHATCELCHRIFNYVGAFRYFQLRNGTLVPIECNQQPWTGVRAICLTCTAIIGSQSPIPNTSDEE